MSIMVLVGQPLKAMTFTLWIVQMTMKICYDVLISQNGY